MKRHPRESTPCPYPTLFRPGAGLTGEAAQIHLGPADVLGEVLRGARARFPASFVHRLDDVDARVAQRRRQALDVDAGAARPTSDRKSTRLNSSHANISYAVF